MAIRRRYRGCLPPAVQNVTVDGAPAVVVDLVGAFGRGHTMTLDPDAWEAASAVHGDQWTRDLSPAGQWFVGSLGRREIRMARAVLGQVPFCATITHSNRDYLDCRRANLIITPPGKPITAAAGPDTEE